MSKKLITTIYVLVLLFLMSQTVLSIGITPAKKSVTYDSIITSKFSIYNNENKDFIADISFKGELAEYAEVDKKEIFVDAEDKYTHFEVKLRLPKLSPGKHYLQINLLENSPESGNTLIGVNAKVEGTIEVNVPFEGKHIDAKINTFSENKNLVVSIPVINEGSEEIKSVSAEVNLFDEDNNFIKKVKTDTKSVPSKSQTTLIARISNMLFGSYKITSKIIYDGNTKKINESIDHGKKSIKIRSVEINDYQDQNYVDIGINLGNKWNGKQKNVFMEMEIYDDDGNLIDTLKSINFDLDRKEEKKVNVYWGIKGILPGFYTGQLNIVSEGLDETVAMGIELKQNSVIISYDGKEVSNKRKVDLILILIILIIVINIIFVILHMKYTINSKKNR